jgi:transcriptional regulator with XRE-family HTH domain
VDPLKKEFVDLLKAVGWTQAEAARQLCMTSGAVNQIVNPNSPVRPSPTTLRLFKLMVAAARPEAINPQTLELKQGTEPALNDPERRLVESLRAIPAADLPLLYAVLRSVIAAFSHRFNVSGVLRKTRYPRKEL